MKGCTTFQELADLPNYISHTIYKEFIDTQMNEEKKQAAEGEQVMDELSDVMT